MANNPITEPSNQQLPPVPEDRFGRQNAYQWPRGQRFGSAAEVPAPRQIDGNREPTPARQRAIEGEVSDSMVEMAAWMHEVDAEEVGRWRDGKCCGFGCGQACHSHGVMVQRRLQGMEWHETTKCDRLT